MEINDIRLITWICMDGCLVFRNTHPHHIQFKLSKDRKIKSLTQLLNEMSIPFTIKESKKSGVNKLQPFIIRIYGEYARKYFRLLENRKMLPYSFGELSSTEAKAFFHTLCMTDATRYSKDKIVWVTTSQDNINVVALLCINLGIPMWLEGLTKSGFGPTYSCRYQIRYTDNG